MIDPKAKMWNDERILILEKIPGKNTANSSGLVDNRLFTGENTLKASKEPHTFMWYMKYDFGGLPEPLKQKFTSFPRLLKHASDYFNKRGIRVAEIKG